jgi:preprotein translocase subunit SecE
MADKSLLEDPTVEPRLARFAKESKAEMDKVEWPSRKETRNMTIVVLGLTAVMAAVLGALDLGLTQLYAFVRTLAGL